MAFASNGSTNLTGAATPDSESMTDEQLQRMVLDIQFENEQLIRELNKADTETAQLTKQMEMQNESSKKIKSEISQLEQLINDRHKQYLDGKKHLQSLEHEVKALMDRKRSIDKRLIERKSLFLNHQKTREEMLATLRKKAAKYSQQYSQLPYAKPYDEAKARVAALQTRSAELEKRMGEKRDSIAKLQREAVEDIPLNDFILQFAKFHVRNQKAATECAIYKKLLRELESKKQTRLEDLRELQEKRGRRRSSVLTPQRESVEKPPQPVEVARGSIRPVVEEQNMDETSEIEQRGAHGTEPMEVDEHSQRTTTHERPQPMSDSLLSTPHDTFSPPPLISAMAGAKGGRGGSLTSTTVRTPQRIPTMTDELASTRRGGPTTMNEENSIMRTPPRAMVSVATVAAAKVSTVMANQNRSAVATGSDARKVRDEAESTSRRDQFAALPFAMTNSPPPNNAEDDRTDVFVAPKAPLSKNADEASQLAKSVDAAADTEPPLTYPSDSFLDAMQMNPFGGLIGGQSPDRASDAGGSTMGGFLFSSVAPGGSEEGDVSGSGANFGFAFGASNDAASYVGGDFEFSNFGGGAQSPSGARNGSPTKSEDFGLGFNF